LATYPFNFLATYGLLIVTYSIANVPRVVWNLAFLLEGFNGVANVCTYTLQIWHRRQAPVAFDENLVTVREIALSSSGSSTSSSLSHVTARRAFVVGDRVQLNEHASRDPYGVFDGGGDGIVVEVDPVQRILLVRDLWGTTRGWYFEGDLNCPGTRVIFEIG